MRASTRFFTAMASATGRRSCPGRQKANALRFEGSACQPPGHEGAGVDIDSIRAHVGLLDRSVAVHHDFPEVGATVEERLANPQEVVAVLALERDAGPDPGVAEKIPAHCQRQPER